MNLVGTILVGPNEPTLEIALQSFKMCTVDATHALIDNERIDQSSLDLLKKYNCTVFNKKWEWNWGMSRTYLSSTIPQGTKYEIFLDADDEVPETSAKIIRDIVSTNNIGFIKCPYIVGKNVDVLSIERIRMFPPPVVWRGHCHEVPYFKKDIPIYTFSDILIYHHFRGNDPDREDHYIEGLIKDNY